MSSIHDALSFAHPLVHDWFIAKFLTPTEPQILGWPIILKKEAVLISAPTGSGKTLAAFLACIDELIRKALTGTLSHQTEVLYISPLKALSNDIHKNLTQPLTEILKLAEERGLQLPEIRVAVRTGDTLAKERQSMLRKPPHILVTTPESLFILLTAEKSRQALKSIKTVIIDEIHALVNNKRGAHLALSLERLEALTLESPLRIGLSATQKPITQVAEFLMGNHRPKPKIIDIGHSRNLDLAVEVPKSPLGPIASNTLWDEIYDKIANLAQHHCSTLVFVNTRRLAERAAHHLKERLGENLVGTHHGSLSRKLRLEAETQLKHGHLRVLVATASLELGIDIGHVNLVCLIGSPRSIATTLQRIGRSGHFRNAIPKGRIFATTKDELMECAALIQAIKLKELDHLIMPTKPMDILAQQIVASCATEEWQEEELFKLVKKAFPYKHLKRKEFNELLHMLAEGIAGSRGRYSAYLFRDQINHRITARRGARLTAITSGGAIPENALFSVISQSEDALVGTLDEDFAVESMQGDIILLGSTSWKIQHIESYAGRVIVEDAHGAPPNVPFWRGEAPARTEELSKAVATLRQAISDRLFCNELLDENKKSTLKWLQEQCSVNEWGALQLIDYIIQGHAFLGAVPTQKTIIAERFFDESGGMQLIIHAPFGARINKAWGLALRKRFCRSFNFELQATATDNGINIALTEVHSFPLADVFHFLHPNTLKKVLIQAVLQSPLFATRWRWTATRSLALVRFRNGKKVPPNILRMRSDDLLAAVFPDAAACQDNLGGRDIELPHHPLIAETIKDALTEALDYEGLIQVLKKIQEGSIHYLAVDTTTASPFAHEILNANPYAFLDDAPLEERRARAVALRQILPQNLQEIGKLDPAAILEVQAQAWPDIRNADELHDALQTLIALPKDFSLNEIPKIPDFWHEYFKELMDQGRATIARISNKIFWIVAEKIEIFKMIYKGAILEHSLKKIKIEKMDRVDAILTLIRGWLAHLGPVTSEELQDILNLDKSETEQAVLKLEGMGLILRGHFNSSSIPSPIEWCDRRLLARIHKLTLDKLRQEIKPILPEQFVHWLLHWQHVYPATQLKGEHGLLEILKQLQGFEMPANAWESQILCKRMNPYDPHMLDKLCLTGIVSWGRLSPHPAMDFENNSLTEEPSSYKKIKRIMPTSVAPITFFIREERDWMPSHKHHDNPEILKNLSRVAKNIFEFLDAKGASFFNDIVHHTQHLKSEIELGLWELVAAGLITADGFDSLRAIIDPHRRLGKKRKSSRLRFSAGRWSILPLEETRNSTKRAEAACFMLLKRYGVVFRDLLKRERNIPPWRELLPLFRQLEDRGEIRGGRFVSGFSGEQFALPYAVDSLRALRKKEIKKEKIIISAVDPLNLTGNILKIEKIAALSGKEVVL